MVVKKSGSQVEIKREQLCLVGGGDKYHIKRQDRPYLTLCNADGTADVVTHGLIGITDMCEELCKKCLRKYRIALQSERK